MLDPRKYCPQCGGNQLKYRVPGNGVSGVTWQWRLIVMTVGLLTVVLIINRIPSGFALNLTLVFTVLWLLLFMLPLLIMMFVAAVRGKSRQVYQLKCQLCGHQRTMTKEEWLQAGDEPVRTEDLNPQESQQKKKVVQSLIDYFNKK